MTVFSLMKFLIGLVGLILTFIFAFKRWINKKKSAGMKAAITFFSTIGFIILLTLIEFAIFGL